LTDEKSPEAVPTRPGVPGEDQPLTQPLPAEIAGSEGAAAPVAGSTPTEIGAPGVADPAADALHGAPLSFESPLTGPTTSDRPTVIVRFGAMSMLGRFAHSLDVCRCGQKVVIKSDRGQEIGEVVCAWGGCGSPQGVPPQIRGDILRRETHADQVEARHLHDSERRELLYCRKCISERKMPMKLVAAEHLFGGDRIVFYFVSEARVDFRSLVRDLAHEFQTRIEMRQIGVRDEARLLGDYERCGRPLCCRAWIKELEPVSMKMAKVQKATLDPTKISGRCGRLMCCLRYEHETYRELSKNLPRRNTLVMTPEGPAKVLDVDIISQKVSVLLNNGNRISVPVDLVSPPGTAPKVAPAAAAAADVTMEPRDPRSARPAAPTVTEVEGVDEAEAVGSLETPETPAIEPQRQPQVGGGQPGRPDRGSRSGGGGRSGRPDRRSQQGGGQPGRSDRRPQQGGGQSGRSDRRPQLGGGPSGRPEGRPQEGATQPVPPEGGPQEVAGQPGQPGQPGQGQRRGRRRSRRGRHRGRGPGGQPGQGGSNPQGGADRSGPSAGPAGGSSPPAPPPPNNT
jgi:cell fate regulator YaaT (PSP1 superfamily)